MDEQYIDEYIFSGSLPENASTYVTRDADNELYEALRQGKFCYVLNSRQSGKSSLRVRTMSRLREVGVECASIDLSSVSIHSATQENWYADLIVKLIDSFDLDIDFQQWWEKNKLNSSLMKFGNFLEKILLREIKENIVIFIDEIDSVLSLQFSTDYFFAFIRSCYNQRVDNPEYNRLTFCLLGVASPSNLIEDKQRTPFNIGKAISLKGFQLHEVKPLQLGLEGKFSNTQVVMEEILKWTEGQPFLTQKLCQFMVEESERENPRTVEQVVKSRIIENWEFQDEPQHLRTISERIMKSKNKIGFLNLYRKILEGKVVKYDNSEEASDLLLSGLVENQGRLKIYNQLYIFVFNQKWITRTLEKLGCPYAEQLQEWIQSGRMNNSQFLLPEEFLYKAWQWADGKSLSLVDYEFLCASLLANNISKNNSNFENKIFSALKVKEAQENTDKRLPNIRKDVRVKSSNLSKSKKQPIYNFYKNNTYIQLLMLVLGIPAIILTLQILFLQKNIDNNYILRTINQLPENTNFNSSDLKTDLLFSIIPNSTILINSEDRIIPVATPRLFENNKIISVPNTLVSSLLSNQQQKNLKLEVEIRYDGSIKVLRATDENNIIYDNPQSSEMQLIKQIENIFRYNYKDEVARWGYQRKQTLSYSLSLTILKY
ncbi:hypothetical protein HCG51_31545 [Tolypothrix sp. PCC 7910]|uniref:AAA-like domain-containing protein n=1 Tax=Tolypothrix sp. PCC 7910 TaxID=2099387 RepID=UPI0014277BCF|nr:AAA-like domain-containing protein [Tolypothrix sp. PCC 7910]QIR40781.1 hypothetical protein HCG51_31545 [Tolypothrix sp. PCC 7910]